MDDYKKRRKDGRFNPPNTAKPKPLAGEAAGSLSAIFGVLKKKAAEPQSSGAPDGGRSTWTHNVANDRPTQRHEQKKPRAKKEPAAKPA